MLLLTVSCLDLHLLVPLVIKSYVRDSDYININSYVNIFFKLMNNLHFFYS